MIGNADLLGGTGCLFSKNLMLSKSQCMETQIIALGAGTRIALVPRCQFVCISSYSAEVDLAERIAVCGLGPFVACER
jgi:hypothetical protein